ncbi:bifunctional folylpolyglutamate synthase/dihydrofolate synthase, partial [Pseudomonas fluorescens]
PERATHLICGMLNTKDIAGYLRPLAAVSDSLTAISIPNEINTLPAETTAAEAGAVGMQAKTADSAETALRALVAKDPNCRILICGSLYLAGDILKTNG